MSNISSHPHRDMLPGKIRILRGNYGAAPTGLTGQVFVTLGAGETHVTILNDEGRCLFSWVAVFGWSFLFGLPLHSNDITVQLDEPDAIAKALTGTMRIYGRNTDTSEWVARAEAYLLQAMEDVLGQTIGTGVCLDGIILAGPPWLHGLLVRMRKLRPHVFDEIRES